MPKQIRLSVSVVVPCYNEESSIVACLDALAAQTLQPLEVLVVDNNSTDKTIQIAEDYAGVMVISESKQGLKPARNRGMNMARGDVIARLDADSVVAPDWVETIVKTMQDVRVQAVSGTGFFYDAPCQKFVRAARNVFAVWLNRLVLGHHMLWGSNMAVRASAWKLIKKDCSPLDNIMEDLDVAMNVHRHFGRGSIVYRPAMRADISARRAMVSLPHNWRYLKMWPYTLSLHNRRRRVVLWPAIVVLLASMAFGNKLARFYNAKQGRMIFSLQQWRSSSLYTRANP